MKLRNKKTGEIVDVESLGHDNSLKEKYGYQVTLSWGTEYENLSKCKDYNSLAELNEDWEDYKPAEPLIKDEKVRKAVRAWAKTIKAKSAFVEKPSYEKADLILSDNFAAISFPIDKPKELDFCRRYTITELCGEEKECES